VDQATKRDVKKRKLEDTAAEKVLEGRGTALTEEEAAEVAKVLLTLNRPLLPQI